MKKLQCSLAVAAMLLAVFFASCSKEKDIESVIPADSTVLMTFDVCSLVENAGGSCDDGVTLPAVLASQLPEEFVKALADLKGIDLSRVYIFGYPTGDGALVASVTDRSSLDTLFDGAGVERQSSGGYTLYSDDGVSVLYDDQLLWIVAEGSGDAVDAVKEYIRSAEKNGSVADSAWRRDYLAQNRSFNCLFNLGTVPMIESQTLSMLDEETPGYENLEKMLQGTMAMGIGLEGTTMKFTMEAFDKEGGKIGMDPASYGMNVSPLSPEFLRYLNSDDVLLLAGGVPDGYPWKQMFESLPGYVSLSDNGVLGEIISTLETIEGTVAVAGGVRNGVASFVGGPEGYDFVLYVTFKPGKAAECLAKIKENVMAGMPSAVKTDGDDLVLDLGSMSVHMGVRGDALVVADRPVTDAGKSVFTPDDFKGLSGVLLLRLDKTSDLCTQLGLPFGIFSKCRLADEYTCEWIVTETDTDGLFLKNIIEYAVAK